MVVSYIFSRTFQLYLFIYNWINRNAQISPVRGSNSFSVNVLIWIIEIYFSSPQTLRCRISQKAAPNHFFSSWFFAWHQDSGSNWLFDLHYFRDLFLNSRLIFIWQAFQFSDNIFSIDIIWIGVGKESSPFTNADWWSMCTAHFKDSFWHNYS